MPLFGDNPVHDDGSLGASPGERQHFRKLKSARDAFQSFFVDKTPEGI